VRVSKLAKDSTTAKLIQLVEQAQGEKANTQRFLEKAEQAYALSVIALTGPLILVPCPANPVARRSTCCG
jgi:Cd2+/Zn2+-exporting ATPase